MKRFFVLLLVLSLLLCACGREQPEQTEPAPQQTEPIPSETVHSGEAEGILDPDTRIVYLLVRSVVTNDAGQELSGKEFAYDDRGFCVSERQYSNVGGSGYTCLHTPDSQGRLAASAYTEPDGTQYTIEYTYDDQGRVRTETVLREEITERTEYTYDDQGNYLTLKQYMGGELAVDYSFSYTYDVNGRKTTLDEYLFGELMYHIRFTYDDQGRETGSTSILSSGEIQSRTESQWDGLTETRQYFSGDETEPFMVSIFTYDDQGNVVFEETRQGDMVLNRAEYIYEPFEVKK